MSISSDFLLIFVLLSIYFVFVTPGCSVVPEVNFHELLEPAGLFMDWMHFLSLNQTYALASVMCPGLALIR